MKRVKPTYLFKPRQTEHIQTNSVIYQILGELV
jgi:hypothetical protein